MDTTASILLVEDDATIADGLLAALTHERFQAHHVLSAEDGLEYMGQNTVHLVISDIMLPGQDGLAFLRLVKQSYPAVPVILLTARTEEIDRVMGLEMGADDYVTKPFSVREVVARVRARLRSLPTDAPSKDTFSFGNVEVDLRRRTLTKAGKQERLTTHEAGTLAYLIEHRGRDVSRDELLENVWNYKAAITTRTVDNQILKLRKKIEDTPAEPRHILTIHGTGYRFET